MQVIITFTIITLALLSDRVICESNKSFVKGGGQGTIRTEDVVGLDFVQLHLGRLVVPDEVQEA